MNSASPAHLAAQTRKFFTIIKLLSKPVMTQHLPPCSKCDSVQVQRWPLAKFHNCLSICRVGLSHPAGWATHWHENWPHVSLKWDWTNCSVQRDGWNASCASPSSTLPVPPASIHYLYQQSDAVPLLRGQLHFGKASLYWLPWGI